MKSKIRPLGKILLEIEPLLEELVDQQELQAGDILYLLYGWIKIHRPDCIEEYLDGTNPILEYGSKEVK